MANEITASFSIAYSDSEGSDLPAFSLDELQVSVATKKFIRAKQNIGITEEAINLGEVTAPRWAAFKNLDETNFIELRVGTGGAKFAKLMPGAGCFVPLGSGAQVPYAIADTAACQMDYLIVSA